MTLTCQLDKQDVFCTWLKDGEELQPDDNVKISSDGFIQQLMLTDVTIKDAARYTCVCGDVSTEATLQVEGMCCLLLIILCCTGMMLYTCYYLT